MLVNFLRFWFNWDLVGWELMSIEKFKVVFFEYVKDIKLNLSLIICSSVFD